MDALLLKLMGVKDLLFQSRITGGNKMIRLKVSVVGVSVSGKECLLSQSESQDYSPDKLEILINSVLDEITPKRNLYSDFEVSVSLSADDESVRPSMHLSSDLVRRLADIGAAFDFDPYV